MNYNLLQLTGAGKKDNRRELDFYPTPQECTIALLDFLKMDISTTIYEPACGDGAISKIFEEVGYKVASSDIANQCYGTGNADYLLQNPFWQKNRDNVAIITNPPFNQAEDFIRKAVSEANIVAMLLKSQYWHAKKRFDLFNECRPRYVLPLTWRPDFMQGAKGGSPTMEVAWSIWINGSAKETTYIPLQKPQ